MSRDSNQVGDELVRLGFSSYEARTYVGLLLAGESTGYRISNRTGVPQPKVYETLRRLVEGGAAVQVHDHPARYFAIPPGELLSRLDRDFRSRLEQARSGLEGLHLNGDGTGSLAVSRLNSIAVALERTREAIEGARARVYLQASRDELRPLASAVGQAASRGVEFVLVHFGSLPFPTPPGRAVRHASTDGAVYSSRAVRHLAAVVDSRWGLWVRARMGQPDEGFYADSQLLASLVKTYIRHDLFVQRIYADFPDELEERYGPGLFSLAEFSGDDLAEEVGDQVG